MVAVVGDGAVHARRRLRPVGGDKFLIGATATLVGSLLRFPTMATSRFGGRNWTVFSAFVLCIPVGATIWILANPGQPLWLYLLCAALCGFGGGNFASSMTNINAFYPQRLRAGRWAQRRRWQPGRARGPVDRSHDGGWLGDVAPYWVCAIYLCLLVLAGIGAALKMDNLELGVDVKAMGRACGKPQHVDHRGALHRHLRLVHRLLVRLRPSAGRLLQRPRGHGAQAALHATDRLHRPSVV